MKRLWRFARALFGAAAQPTAYTPIPTATMNPHVQQQAVDKLTHSEYAQQKFQVGAAIRQANARATELKKACEDLADARRMLSDFRILCYCKRLGMICVNTECRETGCVRKAMEQDDATSQTSRP